MDKVWRGHGNWYENLSVPMERLVMTYRLPQSDELDKGSRFSFVAYAKMMITKEDASLHYEKGLGLIKPLRAPLP